MKTLKSTMILALLLLFNCSFINNSALAYSAYEEDPYSIWISANGDFLFHSGIINSGYNYNVDLKSYAYNFDDILTEIKPYIEQADFSIGNFEGSYNPNYQYSGYPRFNAPKEIFNSISNAGYDLITTANNHSIDTGISGLTYTIDAIRESGMDNIGTYLTDEENKPSVFDINGIQVGFINYTYGCNGLEVTLDEKERLHNINLISEEKMIGELLTLEETVDMSVVIIHWGDEYSRDESDYQRELAQKLVNAGADLILGGHPHVIEATDILYKSGENYPKYVIYSMGNFLSNQSRYTLDYDNAIYTEDGIITFINIEKGYSYTKIKEVKQLPTWVYKEMNSDGYFDYKILPAGELTYGIDTIVDYDSKTMNLLRDSYNRTMEITKNYYFD